MAKLVSFFGTVYATDQAETFVGYGLSDTVSYALVGTGIDIGDYTSGISVNLAPAWAPSDGPHGRATAWISTVRPIRRPTLPTAIS
jgi:hypothetical protein